jgi:hypothetical protein
MHSLAIYDIFVSYLWLSRALLHAVHSFFILDPYIQVLGTLCSFKPSPVARGRPLQ